MEFSLAFEYFLLTFASSFAILQVVSVVKDRKKIGILGNTNLTIALALIVIVLGFAWFFSIRDRSVQTYMEGGQITVIFAFGSFLSVIATKLIKKIWI